MASPVPSNFLGAILGASDIEEPDGPHYDGAKCTVVTRVYFRDLMFFFEKPSFLPTYNVKFIHCLK